LRFPFQLDFLGLHVLTSLGDATTSGGLLSAFMVCMEAKARHILANKTLPVQIQLKTKLKFVKLIIYKV
jgi:hypothetical protein